MRYITHSIQEEEAFLRFTSGDEAALGYIYNQLYRPLIVYGKRMVADEFEVATIVQEAFMRLWEFRERISSMLHAFRFLRMVVRWKCGDYYRQPVSRFRHRCIVYPGNLEGRADAQDHVSLQQQLVQEEQVQMVYKIIPYLSPTRQTMMQLYFKYGFSCKQIAGRFHTSNMAVSLELQKSLHFLKQIIHHAKKASRPPTGNSLPVRTLAEGELTETQQTIFTLRFHERKSFGQVAALLGMEQCQVQQLYVQAWNLVRKKEQAKKGAGHRPHMNTGKTQAV